MPQPLKPGSVSQSGPDTVLTRPDLAAQIGNVCANWNLVEGDLMMIYAILMGDYLPKLPGSVPPTHPVAYQVFDSLHAFGTKIDLLEKLLAWRASEITLAHFRSRIRPELRKRFKERSVIAHGVWGICDEQPDALILLPTYGHREIWKKSDFQDVSCRILEVHRMLDRLIADLYRRRKRSR